MQIGRVFIFVTLFMVRPLVAAAAPQVLVAPLPSIYPASAVFALSANGKPVPVVGFSSQYDYAVFTLSGGPCHLEVTRLDGNPIGRQSVSPLKLGLRAAVAGSTLAFDVAEPRYLIVSIEGLRRLVIAIDPPEADAPAASGAGVYNVAADRYRADAGGAANATVAIQRAVDDAGKDPSGRGIVYVPDGVFRLTELKLVSNVSLYLAPGAVLRCSGERGDFHVRFRKDSMKRDGAWFIYTADGAANVRIFGRGTIDGDGKSLIKRTGLLNHLVLPMNCSHFSIDGPVLRDSGLWGTVIANSRQVELRNTKHFNYLDIGEDDCIDVCNSQDVLVQRSIAISLDDPYSTKTWGEETDLSRQWSGIQQDNRGIRFEDCIAWTRCFGFKVGAGVWRTQEDITVQGGVVYDAAHAIGISATYGTADVHNVRFDDVDVERTGCECLGRSWARFAIDGHDSQSGHGRVYDIHVSNFRVRDAGTKPVPIEGLNADRTIDGVTFEHIVMPGRDSPAADLAELHIGQVRYSSEIVVRN